MKKDLFPAYLPSNPTARERSLAWRAAAGLQDVDGLTPSEFLVNTAMRNIVTIQWSKFPHIGSFFSQSLL